MEATLVPQSTRSIRLIVVLASFKLMDSRIAYSSEKTYIRDKCSKSR